MSSLHRLAMLAIVAFSTAAGCADVSDEENPEDVGAETADLTKARFANPIIRDEQCPDPSVRQWGANYFMVCTGPTFGGDRNAFKLRWSHDLVHWHDIGHVFENGAHPKWAHAPQDSMGWYWAPEINRINDKWHVVFAASDKNKCDSMAIGVATADKLEGPWTVSDEPLVSTSDGSEGRVMPHACGAPIRNSDETGGRIDPTIVRFNGQLYLYYVHQPEFIRVVQLDPTGTKVIPGTSKQLMLESGKQFRATLGWERTTVEGVEAHVENGQIYLLYSGASTWDGSYAVGVARSKSPYGPFEKKGAPILSTRPGSGLVGPGHSSQWVTGPNGKKAIFYHVQRKGQTGYGGARLLCMDDVTFENGWPKINDGHPSEGLHPVP
jgi:arabinan endo-1,5-alpha-L-arabinosidase